MDFLGDLRLPNQHLARRNKAVEQEHLEGGELLRVCDFMRRAVQNVKQQRFQDLWRIVPTVEVKGLKAGKGKSVVGVVEEKTVLSATGPAVKALFQLANDVPKVRDCALVWFQHVDALDCLPEASFLLEVEPVTLLVAL